MPDFDAQAFLADVLASVPEDKKQVVEEAFKLEPVVKTVSESAMRKSDYSRQLDKLREEREASEARIAEQTNMLSAERQRYAEWYEDALAKYNQKVDLARRYEAEYGPLDQEGQNGVADRGLTKEEFDRQLNEALERQSRQAVTFADVLTDIKLDHRDRFSEPLDTEKLYAHHQKTGLPIKQAYEDFIRPRVDEAQKAKYEEQLKQAREEGRQEGLSSAQLPTNPSPSEHHPLRTLEKPTTSEDRVAAAVAAWNADSHTR